MVKTLQQKIPKEELAGLGWGGGEIAGSALNAQGLERLERSLTSSGTYHLHWR